MGGITLNSAVRNNLYALQATARLLSQTQDRLATGKRVNSALDNPASFFTASAMNNRAAGLNRLLDTMSSATQTIKAADDGLTALTTLVQKAQSTALLARQTASTVSQVAAATIVGTGTLSPDAIATATGTQNVASETDFVNNTAIANNNKLELRVNEINYTINFGGGGSDVNDAVELEAAIDAIAGISASYNGSNQLVIVRDDSVNTFEIRTQTHDDVRDVLGITEQVYNPTNLLTQGITAGQTLTVTVGSASAQTITFGTNSGAGEVATLAELNTAIGALTGLSTKSVNLTSGGISLTATSITDSITIGGTADETKFGLAAGVISPVTTQIANPAREGLRLEFNSLLTQIDQAAADSGISGTNLLAGDSLRVVFNETGTSSLTVSGISLNQSSLGITTAAASAFDTDGLIDNTLAELDAALSTLSIQASSFGTKLSVVQIREDFTTALINSLQTGADNLTLADLNEESAMQLALETRFQISTEMLSISANHESQVLRLFA